MNVKTNPIKKITLADIADKKHHYHKFTFPLQYDRINVAFFPEDVWCSEINILPDSEYINAHSVDLMFMNIVHDPCPGYCVCFGDFKGEKLVEKIFGFK